VLKPTAKLRRIIGLRKRLHLIKDFFNIIKKEQKMEIFYFCLVLIAVKAPVAPIKTSRRAATLAKRAWLKKINY